MDPIAEAEETRIDAELAKFSHRFRSQQRSKSGIILHTYPDLLGEYSFDAAGLAHLTAEPRLAQVTQRLLSLCGQEDNHAVEEILGDQDRQWVCAKCRDRPERPDGSEADHVNPIREGFGAYFDAMVSVPFDCLSYLLVMLTSLLD